MIFEIVPKKYLLVCKKYPTVNFFFFHYNGITRNKMENGENEDGANHTT